MIIVKDFSHGFSYTKQETHTAFGRISFLIFNGRYSMIPCGSISAPQEGLVLETRDGHFQKLHINSGFC